MTARRYPRTLYQAFPQDHAGWLTHYRAPLADRVRGYILAVGIGIALGLLLVTAIGG